MNNRESHVHGKGCGCGKFDYGENGACGYCGNLNPDFVSSRSKDLVLDSNANAGDHPDFEEILVPDVNPNENQASCLALLAGASLAVIGFASLIGSGSIWLTERESLYQFADIFQLDHADALTAARATMSTLGITGMAELVSSLYFVGQGYNLNK